MEHKIYLLSEGDAGWNLYDQFPQIKPCISAYQKKFSDDEMYWCINIESMTELINIKKEVGHDIILEQNWDEIRLIVVDSNMTYIESTSRYFYQNNDNCKTQDIIRYQLHGTNKPFPGEELNKYYIKKQKK